MKKSLLPLLIVVGLSVTGQNGFIDQYGNVKGTHVLVRTAPTGFYTISCSHSNHDVSTFVTEINGSSYQCSTSTYVEDNGLSPFPVKNNGYHISDMRLDDSVCWVCGYVWQETGEWVFNQQGLGYKETRRKGFIGKFNAVKVAQSTSDFFQYVTVDSVASLDRLALTSGGAVAIGRSHDSTSRVVELAESTNNGYTLKCARSNDPQEVFMDVVRAGNRVVTLSRYNNYLFGNPFYYRYCFGLRYGTLSNFMGTSYGVYLYSTYRFYVDNSTSFTGVDPIFLSATGSGNGVTVSYLATDGNVPAGINIKGHFVMYNVTGQGSTTTNKIFHNADTCTYRRLRDTDCPSSNFTTLLLEDSTGQSVLRFVQLTFNSGNPQSQYALRLASPWLESLCGYMGNTSSYNLSVAGRYPSEQNKTAYLREKGLPGRLPYWNGNNCEAILPCFVANCYDNGTNHYTYLYEPLNLNWQTDGDYLEFKLYSYGTTPTRKCTDVQ